MPSKSLSRSSLLSFQKYSSLLAGNDPYIPFSSDFDLLETEILASDAASVEFTSGGVWANYAHLQIRATTRTDRTGTNGIVNIGFNSDTTAANYRNHELFGDSSTVYSLNYSGYNNIRVALRGAAVSSAADFYGPGVIDILDINSTSKNTTIRSLSGDQNIIALNSGCYFQTSAITTITFTPESASNIVAGSRFSIYGLKAA